MNKLNLFIESEMTYAIVRIARVRNAGKQITYRDRLLKIEFPFL